MITLYDPRETRFDHNGLITLLPIAADVTEELNGPFELTLDHPIDDAGRWRFIQENHIVKAPTPRGEQLFRVYKVQKRTDNTVKANARHIFYDVLTDNLTVSAQKLSPDEAIKAVYAALEYHAGRFAVSSDLPGEVNVDFLRINPVQALMDGEESLIGRTSGELWRDNFTVRLQASIGGDYGVEIRYRKNLTGLDYSLDMTDAATVIRPVGVAADGGDLYLPEKDIFSPYVERYPFPMLRVAAFSDIRVGGDYPTPEAAFDEMRLRAGELLAQGVDLPKINAKVEFVELGKTVEFKDYAALETVALGDMVTVIHEKLSVNVSAKVVKYTYDAVLKRYKSLEIGETVDNMAKTFANMERDRRVMVRSASGVKTALSETAALDARVTAIEESLQEGA